MCYFLERKKKVEKKNKKKEKKVSFTRSDSWKDSAIRPNGVKKKKKKKNIGFLFIFFNCYYLKTNLTHLLLGWDWSEMDRASSWCLQYRCAPMGYFSVQRFADEWPRNTTYTPVIGISRLPHPLKIFPDPTFWSDTKHSYVAVTL